ncbi:MAG: bifunctional phosphoribosyl-AMP cyclohydrolase/phosphoribosyl-ATP diphosphatase HisIE [Epsilonproteobacteria bacterium]|nr:bifunctional phosphoribosyl-AMP cyclohydrolase/phosphoribosyl-ATP diphosphatase HisIE [Campylobacterota bacterium]
MRQIVNRVDWKKNPLIPAIAQDYKSGKVLMLAYMDRVALELTLSTKIAHYFSRSRQRIWKKGETSGNIQKVKDIFIDCDDDTILLQVEQIGGAACHTGRESCFFTKLESATIISDPIENSTDKYSITDKLYHAIQERKNADPNKSYVASLYKKGENTILKKVVEEAGEFCFALKDKDEKEIIYECADLVFHTLVALSYSNINPERIKNELSKRFGKSGIEEKQNRTK